MKLKPQKGAWILGVLFLIGVVFPVFSAAKAIDGKSIVFSWQEASISQTINPVDIVNKTSITFSVSAAETQDWKPSSDQLNIGIALYGVGGGLIYQHSTGTLEVDSSLFTDYSISINAADVAGWNETASIKAFIIGKDGEFWAGNYGTRVESASLKFEDNTELLSNTEFSSGTLSWISDLGWQSCSGGSGSQPCLSSLVTSTTTTTTTTTIPANNSNYSLTPNMTWGTADEGWNLSVSAPGGGIFTRVVFASYGNPNGTAGQYTQNWCHATNSILKVSEAFIGRSSATIGASNGIFGDPCGGTYKRLYVVLEYSGRTTQCHNYYNYHSTKLWAI